MMKNNPNLMPQPRRPSRFASTAVAATGTRMNRPRKTGMKIGMDSDDKPSVARMSTSMMEYV